MSKRAPKDFLLIKGIGNVSSILIDMMVRFFPNFIGDKEKENFERCGIIIIDAIS
jgi:hypothetical protein